jgi:hypothetical protein
VAEEPAEALDEHRVLDLVMEGTAPRAAAAAGAPAGGDGA